MCDERDMSRGPPPPPRGVGDLEVQGWSQDWVWGARLQGSRLELKLKMCRKGNKLSSMVQNRADTFFRSWRRGLDPTLWNRQKKLQQSFALFEVSFKFYGPGTK